ncbi:MULTISPECIES: CoA ester lyase [unclassified Methylobacterium]|jgi:citrate lyase subunit beta/citryl-CoA lyase|uniref:HpcH/HpaI aldolase/citrate lyase family protein n=1 Tax=unclassified Methylobacterium TaxID=2615210 RepID=UPI0008F11EA4|nr:MULTISPECIES: CoA ester lyase [unclassified Methylobacterium]SFU94336.1 citrate lyase subunit beta / citryl-CoA lyase [Methylobacterium sp. UNCCL125]
MMKLRTLLFAPADSERKCTKALASSADGVILDLEDSVAANAKVEARMAASAFLAAAPDRSRAIVRINPRDTDWYLGDLAAIAPRAPAAILLPKCTGPADLAALDHHLEALEAVSGLTVGSIGILALVTETAASLRDMAYAGVTPRLRALLFGAEDLAADFGIAPRSADGAMTAPVLAARAALLIAAAQAQVPAIDTPWPDPRDPDGLARELAAAARDGFAGKLCIHPDQLAAVTDAFTPTPERVRWAEAVRDLFAERPASGVLVLDGKMVDRPHLRLAERILASAAEAP